MNHRDSPHSISHHRRRYRQLRPVHCLGSRREDAGMPPQEKGRRMWDMRRTTTLMRESLVTTETSGSELRWQSCPAQAVRRALGRPSSIPSYRWTGAGQGHYVGAHRNAVRPARASPPPSRRRRRPHPYWKPAPLRNSQGNLNMYKSVRGFNALIVISHIPFTGGA